ncbi:MAG: cell wall hydrolase [Rhodobacteraceae bacterium]|nr:cell wall hydrolase [Paracoccaceae bacterium]
MLKFAAVSAIVLSIFAPSAQASEIDQAKPPAPVAWIAQNATNSKWLSMLKPRARPKHPPPRVKYTRDWVDAQPKATGDKHWQCLAEALYFEARSETVKGQFAVAEVIMNRVKSTRFPDNLCGVINEGTGKLYQCQFTYTCDGQKEFITEKKAFERVAKIARAVIDGGIGSLTDGATHYHTTAVRPSWARVYTYKASIGMHRFYRHTYRTASN